MTWLFTAESEPVLVKGEGYDHQFPNSSAPNIDLAVKSSTFALLG